MRLRKNAILLLLLAITFLFNACKSNNEYAHLANEFYTTYFNIIETMYDVTSGDSLKILKEESNIARKNELDGMIKKIKDIAPRDRTDLVKDMEEKLNNLNELFKISKIGWDAMSVEQRFSTRTKINIMRVDFMNWKEKDPGVAWW